MTATVTPPRPPTRRAYTGGWSRRVTATLANSSLRTVLVATFTVLMIGTLGVVGWLSYQAGEQAVTTLANQLMAEIGDRIDQRLARYLAGLRNVADTNAVLIRQGRLDPNDSGGLERYFAAQLGLFPGADSIGLVTEQREMLMVARLAPDALIIRRFNAATGYRLQHYRADLDGRQGALIESRRNYDPHNDPPGKPWYPAVRAAGQGSWRLSVSLAKGQDHPVLINFYALPFGDPQDRTRGVLFAGMTLIGMSDFLQGLRVSAHGQAFLADRDGLLVATSTGETPFDSRARTDHAQNVAVETRRLPAVASADPVTREAARQLLARQPALQQLATPLRFDFDVQGQRYLAKVSASSAAISHPDWLTLVVAPQRDFTTLVAAPFQQLLLLVALAVLIAVLLGLVAAGAISRPLGQLNAATRRLAEGDFDQPLPPAPIRELRELGESFGKMTGRLRAAFFELRDLNQTLRTAERALALHNEDLEQRVTERTTALVTAQARIAEAMAQVTASEAKFRAMFEQSPLGIALIDPLTGRPLEVNERLLRIIGWTREDLVARGWVGVTHPDDLAVELAQVARLRAGESAGFQLEKRYLRDDGTVIWGDLTVTSVDLGDGARRLHLCLVEDITARKTAEARVQANERRTRRMLDYMPTAIAACTLEPEPRVTYLNEQFVRTFGYTLEDIPRMRDWALSAYPDEGYRRASMDWWNAAVATAIPRGGQVESREFRVTCKDGTVRAVVISATALEDVLVAAFLDITERERAETALRKSEERYRLLTETMQQARDAAETANRSKSEFLAHMSHEIRTPLNVVLGLAQVLSREPLTAAQRDTVVRIGTAGQSLLAIINDILDLSKIEAAQLRLEPRPFTLETLLTRLDSLMAPTAQAKGLVFHVAGPPVPLGQLLGDALRLEQVLLNLIGNAVKFTEQGEVTLSVIALRTDVADVRLRFAVRDTGIGIPPAAQERLFTPFTQAEEGISRRFGGTGLGLSISKRLLELMGEEIGVASQVGQGSTFWFELSLAWATAAAGVSATTTPDRASPPRSAGPRLAGAHFLVVDDSAMNRDLVERALAFDGATATLAADGQQALQQLRARPGAFAAVLMDVRMPVMDGLTATRLIREDLGLTELPVIALTAGVLTEQQDAARAAGVDALLGKPLDLEQLAILLLEWVKPTSSGTVALTAAGPAEPTAAGQSVTGHDAAGAFPDIAGIDRARAAVTLGHNRDLFFWLLRRIADEYATAEAQTREDLAQGERDQAARRMHTLGSNAGSLGALELMALARELEGAIDRGETDLEARLAVFGGVLTDLLAAGAPWLNVPSASAAAASEDARRPDPATAPLADNRGPS